MWVERCYDLDGISDYLSRYFSRDFSEPLSEGVRHWSTMGGFPGCQKNSLVVNTPATRAVRAYKSVVLNGGKVPFARLRDIMGSQNITDPEHLAACIGYALQNKGCTLAFTWSWARLEQEAGLLKGNPLDGRIPF